MNVKLKFGVFDLSKPNLDSGWIQWNLPFSAWIRNRIRNSSFDADSPAKPEVNDVTPASQMWTDNNDVTLDHAHESRPFDLPVNPNPDSLRIWI